MLIEHGIRIMNSSWTKQPHLNHIITGYMNLKMYVTMLLIQTSSISGHLRVIASANYLT